MEDYTEVETTVDLGKPGDFDYVPAGSRGMVFGNIGSTYPYTVRFNELDLMPWLVNADDVRELDSTSAVS